MISGMSHYKKLTKGSFMFNVSLTNGFYYKVPAANKLINEQFKVWKKTIPSLYQYITSFKARYASANEAMNSFNKSIVFTKSIEPDKEKGIIRSSALVSIGDAIYEISFFVPLGIHLEDSASDVELPDPAFENNPAFTEAIQPLWRVHNKSINKMIFIGDKKVYFVALCSDGTVAWFKSDCQESINILAPSNSLEIDCKEISAVDLTISIDGSKLVRIQAVDSVEKYSIITVIDNKICIGKELASITIPNILTNHVEFHNNNLFSVCCSDNTLRFWDTRNISSDSIWQLREINKNDGSITCFDVFTTLEVLFVTGSDNGVTKLWDLRSVIAAGDKQQPEALIRLYHPDNDPIADLLFSVSSPTVFVTVGQSGNVYHWDICYLFQQVPKEDVEDDLPSEDFQQQCLTFLHTGGGRRSLGKISKKNTVAWHDSIGDLIGCVDFDGLITVYKPYLGREEDSDYEENDQFDEIV